jgi:protein-arginine kinase activator protein McsA
MKSKQTAQDAYLTRMESITSKIGKVQNLASDHFGHDPESINWAHVGDLGRIEALLDDLIEHIDGKSIEVVLLARDIMQAVEGLNIKQVITHESK